MIITLFSGMWDVKTNNHSWHLISTYIKTLFVRFSFLNSHPTTVSETHLQQLRATSHTQHQLLDTECVLVLKNIFTKTEANLASISEHQIKFQKPLHGKICA